MIQPKNNNILFKPFLQEAVTENGIIVPDSFRGESDKGVIIAVGRGTSLREMKLKPDTIGYRVHKWGEPIDIEGERHYLMEDKAIIAVE